MPGSVFGAVDGGYAVLLDALVRQAQVDWVHVGVKQVGPDGRGWSLVDDEGRHWHADGVVLTAGTEPTRALLIAGAPLNEAIAQHGPFVMNTRDELVQAFADYQSGRF